MSNEMSVMDTRPLASMEGAKSAKINLEMATEKLKEFRQDPYLLLVSDVDGKGVINLVFENKKLILESRETGKEFKAFFFHIYRTGVPLETLIEELGDPKRARLRFMRNLLKSGMAPTESRLGLMPLDVEDLKEMVDSALEHIGLTMDEVKDLAGI